MGTWRAECWLGSSVGTQILEVQANTLQGAHEQLERIYGAEQIVNLREVSSRGGGGSSSSGGELSTSSMIALFVIMGLIWFFITYTPFVVMGVLGAVGVWIGSKFENKFVALIVTVVLGGLGFYLGTDWANQIESRIDEPDRVEESKSIPDGNSSSNSTLIRNSNKNTPAPQIAKPRELTTKEKGCQIWRNAFPDAAAKLKQGDSCYE